MKIEQLLREHIAREENSMAELNKKVETLASNHVFHLELAVNSLKERMTLVLWVFGIVGSALLLAIVGAVLTLILR